MSLNPHKTVPLFWDSAINVLITSRGRTVFQNLHSESLRLSLNLRYTDPYFTKTLWAIGQNRNTKTSLSLQELFSFLMCRKYCFNWCEHIETDKKFFPAFLTESKCPSQYKWHAVRPQPDPHCFQWKIVHWLYTN